MAETSAKTLEELFGVIESRKDADPEASYTAKLIRKGRAKIAQKLGEEAVETAIAGVQNRREEVIAESADLLYHLLVLWADCGIAPREVMAELEQRKGVSGYKQKGARED